MTAQLRFENTTARAVTAFADIQVTDSTGAILGTINFFTPSVAAEASGVLTTNLSTVTSTEADVTCGVSKFELGEPPG